MDCGEKVHFLGEKKYILIFLPIAQDSRDARLPLLDVQRLAQDIRQLLGGSDPDQLDMTILDHIMSEVLPDVNVLHTLSTTNDVVSPLDAHSVVLVHQSRVRLGEANAFDEITKVQNLRLRRRRRIVLRFGSA